MSPTKPFTTSLPSIPFAMKHTDPMPEQAKELATSRMVLTSVENPESLKILEPFMAKEQILTCQHCGGLLEHVKLSGMSVICPSCGRVQNGLTNELTENKGPDAVTICKHCGRRIDQATLQGISLICPFCGAPQNGVFHPKT